MNTPSRIPRTSVRSRSSRKLNTEPRRTSSANKKETQVKSRNSSRKGRNDDSTVGRCELDETRVENRDLCAPAGKWHGKNSLSVQRFDRLKTGDPFASKTRQTMSSFEHAYANGAIPCRIDHGGVISRLKWDRQPQDLEYDPLLVTVANGLSETTHPFVFVSQNAFRELLQARNGKQKTIPLLGQIVRELRRAMLSKNDDTFIGALNAIQQLSNAVGETLTDHISSSLLIQINKKYFNRKFKQLITETLITLERNGGSKARHLIKQKVPLFS